MLAELYRAISAERAELETALTTKQQRLTDLGVEMSALQDRPHLRKLYLSQSERLAVLAREVSQLRAQLANATLRQEALDLRAAELQAGRRGPARAHLRRPARPSAEVESLGRFAEVWAAVSITLMVFGFVGVALFAREYLMFGLIALLAVVLFVEAGFRRQLPRLITSVTLALAAVGALVLVYEFFWELVVTGVLMAGAYIMWENLRELRG
jgi:hypothetical protein